MALQYEERRKQQNYSMRFQIALAYHAYPDSHMFILWNLFAENIHMIFQNLSNRKEHTFFEYL